MKGFLGALYVITSLSVAEVAFSNEVKAWCVGICPGPRPVYTRPYTYRRPIIVAPVPVPVGAAAPLRTICSRTSGSVNAFFRPNYSSSVVANLPVGQSVAIESFVTANRESWGLANLGGASGYVPSINLC